MWIAFAWVEFHVHLTQVGDVMYLVLSNLKLITLRLDGQAKGLASADVIRDQEPVLFAVCFGGFLPHFEIDVYSLSVHLKNIDLNG